MKGMQRRKGKKGRDGGNAEKERWKVRERMKSAEKSRP